jgi:hypothetical protein
MREIWKDIEGYEGYYQVSNLGRVKSLDRVVSYKNGVQRLYRGHIIPQRKRRKGDNYLSVSLYKNGTYKTCVVHRLVATAFIPNPKEKPQVNHKDENPENNCVDNLEWVTAYENMHYNDLIGRISRPTAKAINAYDSQGDLIYSFDSLGEAERHGFNRFAISSNINGRTKTSGGYTWKKAE